MARISLGSDSHEVVIGETELEAGIMAELERGVMLAGAGVADSFMLTAPAFATWSLTFQSHFDSSQISPTASFFRPCRRVRSAINCFILSISLSVSSRVEGVVVPVDVEEVDFDMSLDL